MRQNLFIFALGAAVLVTGCATKNYVKQTVDPVNTKVGEVADQANKQGTDIAQSKQDISKNTTAIQATDEKATGAGRRADDAMTKANQVDQKADQTNRDLGQLRQTVANLDDYKVVDQGTVLFAVNRATLTPDSKQQLDAVASKTGTMKRYFVAVEGYTDTTGPAAYNLELSKRRADAVVQYLAGEKDMDFNHIHTIGLGDQKLVDPGKTRDSRAKNRRVEVKIYSADDALAVSQR
jgi:outer membrane protein OmpA-like peptidoglycan-associated protein